MRALFGPLLIAALWSCSAFASANPIIVQGDPLRAATFASDPQGAIARAREQVAAGDLNGAINELATYVAGHPEEIAPARLLGDLYFRRGDLKKAEETYQRILANAAGDKETHSRLGAVYAAENRIDDAIAQFDRSLPGTDSVPDLVQLHLRKGDLKRYQAEREEVAQHYPTDVEAQLELGEVYEALHEPQRAILYFNRALDNDKGSVFALNGLGLAFMQERDYPHAIQEFTACLRRDAANYPCMDNVGAAYLESSQYTAAAPVLANAHRLAPERSEALVNLGYLAEAQGDWKKGVSLYVQAMTVYPYSPDAYIDLGYTYDTHGLYELAQAALLKGLAIAPYDGRLHFLLGDTYEREGKHTLAQGQFAIAAGGRDLDPEVQALARDRVAALQRTYPGSLR